MSAVPFARRRLRLGITGVGVSVVAALVWLAALHSASLAPDLILALTPLFSVGEAHAGIAPRGVAALTAVLFTAHALLLLPVEFLGGRTMARDRLALGAWLRAWLRGVVALGVVAATAAAVVAWFVARGLVLPVAGLVVACALLAAQPLLARVVARMDVWRLADAPTAEHRAATGIVAAVAQRAGIDPGFLRLVDAGDRGFVGGWVGIGRPQLWLPVHWAYERDSDVLAVELVRRDAQRRGGAHAWGLFGAAAWVALGLALATPLLPGTPRDLTWWAALPAVSVLWSFVGVLFLPTLSKPAVFAADRVAARTLGVPAVAAAIRTLDGWQDDEPTRTPLVESIFHPVPSVARRIAALDALADVSPGMSRAARDAGQGARAAANTVPNRAPNGSGGAWQLTRRMLYAALAALSPLGRAVHCNIGRPALWVVLPGD